MSTETLHKPATAASAHALAEVEAGLDQLSSAPRTARRSLASSIALPILAVVILTVIWQVYVSVSGVRRDLVPGPLDVAGSLGKLLSDCTLQGAVWTSLSRGVIGFVLSVVIALVIGLILAQVSWLRRAFGPLIAGLQVLPSVAWVPAAIIWFGLSEGTVYFVIFLGAIPSIITGLLSGVDQVPPHYRAVGKILGANRRQLITKIVLPAALPGILGGLKQGWAFSWRSLMAAEIIAMGGTLGFGLGSLLQQGRELSDLGVVMSAILAILVVGILVELLVFAPLERRILRRRGILAA